MLNALLSILVLVTPGAAAAAIVEDPYDVITSPDLPYTDVLPAMRAVYDFDDPALMREADQFFSVALAMPSDSLEWRARTWTPC